MSVRIIRLGTRRAGPARVCASAPGRRPPRGVAKSDYLRAEWYDVCYPLLSPTSATLKRGLQADTAAKWAAFERKVRGEMSATDASRTLDLLAALSPHANFSIGCCCEDESRCHRSVLP